MNREERHPLPAAMRERVLDELERIEREHDVVVLYACESGSRAWGFASPDSDYDVRFVYVHQPEWYQRVEEPRDVIERPLSDELDISGWELRKALRLMRKSNPALLEWLGSPLVYREEPGVREELLWLGSAFHSVPGSRHHYLSMARKNYRGYLKGDSVRLKKYLYVLRPLFAVRWLDAGLGLPPVAFERLVEATLDDPSLREELDALLSLSVSATNRPTALRAWRCNASSKRSCSRPNEGPPNQPARARTADCWIATSTTRYGNTQGKPHEKGPHRTRRQRRRRADPA